MPDCDNLFWRFSLVVYATPGVAAECLALQAALNVDVNVLLFCAWLGRTKQLALTETDFETIDAHVRRWHDAVVRPLRAVRQHMKAMPEIQHDTVKDLRKAVAGDELRAEQIEQALLFDLVAVLAGEISSEDAVRRNVMAFLQRKRQQHSPAVVEPPAAERLITAAMAHRA